MSMFHSFYGWIILHYTCTHTHTHTPVCLSIHLLLDTWAAPTFWQLWAVQLLWINVYSNTLSIFLFSIVSKLSLFFHWSIVDLQYCISFWCTENDSVIYTHTHTYAHILFYITLSIFQSGCLPFCCWVKRVLHIFWIPDFYYISDLQIFPLILSVVFSLYW